MIYKIVQRDMKKYKSLIFYTILLNIISHLTKGVFQCKFFFDYNTIFNTIANKIIKIAAAKAIFIPSKEIGSSGVIVSSG